MAFCESVSLLKACFQRMQNEFCRREEDGDFAHGFPFDAEVETLS